MPRLAEYDVLLSGCMQAEVTGKTAISKKARLLAQSKHPNPDLQIEVWPVRIVQSHYLPCMQAEVNGKKAISKNARLLARAVGPQAPIWVELLDRIPPKSEQLLLSMLLPLTGKRSLNIPSSTC